ncbi:MULTISPECIES: SixA phosphatase family protein [Sphingomonas]|uniref:Histidine phosphatase family protein n=1 Tax=Sphingomonas kyungheensis TaxID=1069987 RepID=A0ABU8H3Z5_9SPHN|nr:MULTISPECIES: histidine phosphatase family protein [unclassified Sphingomonas]EZP51011.1 Phosphoglycerate mutase family protein [Sphingomonas sp. RIT328]
MKTLTLLRHAKSGWDDTVSRDFDRPLNAKGRRAAEAVGRHMRSLDLGFDHVVASPAVRVGETLDAIVAGYGRRLSPVWERRVYLASAATLLDLIHELPEGAERVLLVGHNPGLEDLALMLVPAAADGLRGQIEEKYPTATLAELSFDGGWPSLAPGGATLTRFIRPRDLDPSLGPDG